MESIIKFFNLVTSPHVNFRKISIFLCHMYCCLVHCASWRETEQAKRIKYWNSKPSVKILIEPCQSETGPVSAVEDLWEMLFQKLSLTSFPTLILTDMKKNPSIHLVRNPGLIPNQPWRQRNPPLTPRNPPEGFLSLSIKNEHPVSVPTQSPRARTL